MLQRRREQQRQQASPRRCRRSWRRPWGPRTPRGDGNHAQAGRGGGQQDRPAAVLGGFTNGVQGERPACSKASIWVTRNHRVAMMMRSAPAPRGWRPKPSGWPRGSAQHHPDQAQGATLATGNSLRMLCSWIIRKVAMRNSISGTTSAIGPWALLLSSTVPPPPPGSAAAAWR